MTTTWVNFKQIKADVAIDAVLERYGVLAAPACSSTP
jgi:hypothetical protein